MKIVPFIKDDQKAAAAFMDMIWDEMGQIDKGWKKKPKDHFSDLDKFFHIPTEGFLLLMKDDNKIIGTGGCVQINPSDALLKRFYIDKNYRGTGVASELFIAILQSAKTFHASRIVIDVSKNNARALRFYEKCGFKPYNPEANAMWPESSRPDTFNYYFLSLERN